MNLSKFDIKGRSDVGAGGVVGLGILYCLSLFGFSNKKWVRQLIPSNVSPTHASKHHI